MEIRRAQARDAGAVTDIYLRSFHAALPTVHLAHTDDEVRGWIREVLIPGEECWVAESGRQIVGMMALRPGWVDQLYVAPEWSDRGIGRRLLDLAKDGSDGRLELWTFGVNERARRFYERNGFEMAEETDGSGNEEREPDVRYVWTREAEA